MITNFNDKKLSFKLLLTLEQRTQLTQCSNGSSTGVLANGQLHEEQRNAAYEQYYAIRY